MRWKFWKPEPPGFKYESKRTCRHLAHKQEWALYGGFSRLCVYCFNCDSFFGDMSAHQGRAKPYRESQIEAQHAAEKIVTAATDKVR